MRIKNEKSNEFTNLNENFPLQLRMNSSFKLISQNQMYSTEFLMKLAPS